MFHIPEEFFPYLVFFGENGPKIKKEAPESIKEKARDINEAHGKYTGSPFFDIE